MHSNFSKKYSVSKFSSSHSEFLMSLWETPFQRKKFWSSKYYSLQLCLTLHQILHNSSTTQFKPSQFSLIPETSQILATKVKQMEPEGRESKLVVNSPLSKFEFKISHLQVISKEKYYQTIILNDSRLTLGRKKTPFATN